MQYRAGMKNTIIHFKKKEYDYGGSMWSENIVWMFYSNYLTQRHIFKLSCYMSFEKM